MKDIYELLNDIDIDEKELEEMKAYEFEREKVKRNLKQSIHQKKKMKKWKKGAAAASILVGLSVATLGIGFPTYAGGLPIVGDIFRFLDNGRTGLYENYKEFSTELNMTRESNGVKVTINDAVFDGRTVAITYSIESDKDLGENPNIFGFPQVMGFNGGGGGSKVTKVGEKKYVGMTTMSGHSSKRLDVANVRWDMEAIDMHEEKKSIKGNWNFALSLKAMDSKEIKLQGNSEKEGIKVNVDKMEVTPMSFIVFYNQEESKELRSIWDSADVELKIKDDLGNHYDGEGNGGSSTEAEPHKSSWSATFQKLNENATKLIVTPHVNLRVHTPENHGGVEFINGKEKKIEVPKKEAKSKNIVLDDIVIDLNK
ncbi:anti-sigma factor [Bacillus cereus]|uniref:Anti-sigma factor n=1 Tax=Bacillus cereus TaxID=1396 RepID=A0A2B0MS50_BACCE|nr:anti-sigma factor [Bacillus cereus]